MEVLRFGAGALLVFLAAVMQGNSVDRFSRENFVLESIPRAVIHRGVSLGGIENSLSGVRESLEQYPDAEIEIDIRETKDNALVLLHDPKLERETNGRGLVNDYTLKELQGFFRRDSKEKITGERITRLGDVLDLFERYPSARLQIDSKIESEEALEKLADAIRSRPGLSGRVVISSDDIGHLWFLRGRHSHLRLGHDPGPSFIDGKRADAIIQPARALGIDTIYLDYTFLRKVSSDDVREYVGEFQSAGFEIDVWTVDDSWGFGLTASWGVDKITTNRTDTYELIFGTCK